MFAQFYVLSCFSAVIMSIRSFFVFIDSLLAVILNVDLIKEFPY